MATKKIPSMEDALATFKDVMARASLKEFMYSNRVMISKNPKGQSVIVVPDHELWVKITDDQEFMKNVKEIDINDPDKDLLLYGEKLDGTWLEVDTQSVMAGLIFKVTVDSLMYELLINKNMIPLKLKKAEANNISYRVFSSPDVLALKKLFESPVEGGSFTIMRLMQIL